MRKIGKVAPLFRPVCELLLVRSGLVLVRKGPVVNGESEKVGIKFRFLSHLRLTPRYPDNHPEEWLVRCVLLATSQRL